MRADHQAPFGVSAADDRFIVCRMEITVLDCIPSHAGLGLCIDELSINQPLGEHPLKLWGHDFIDLADQLERIWGFNVRKVGLKALGDHQVGHSWNRFGMAEGVLNGAFRQKVGVFRNVKSGHGGL